LLKTPDTVHLFCASGLLYPYKKKYPWVIA
jgi:hypothetical protein